MKIPDLSIIEKTLNNEATSEESCEVVRAHPINLGD